jgi:nucleotide-binding universal stress UspA family protein
VVLLGWTQVPEQSDAEQVQDEIGDDAEADLEALADSLRGLGMDVETDLVFTGDLVQTIDRVADERDPRAVLSLRPVKTVGRILVALKDTRQADEAAGYAARVAGATGAHVTVMHAPDEDDEQLETTLRARFRRAGVSPERTTLEPSGGSEATIADRILEAAHDADLIIVGETHPAEEEETFGGVNETVTRDAEVPVLIVRVRGAREED